MALIALSVIGCIDYLAYGGIFTRAVFPFVAKEAKNEFFDSRKKAQDVRWEVVYPTKTLLWRNKPFRPAGAATFFSHFFANSGNHLGIACLFHD